MLKPGLVSVTFCDLSPNRIIDLASEAQLQAIEWSARTHVKHGDFDEACRVGQLTRQEGMQVAAYGSYYTLGHSAEEGLDFVDVLATAKALEAPLLRVWAGKQNAEEASASYRQAIIDESRQIADEAAAENIKIVFEYHDNSLTNTAESCRNLLEVADRPNLRTYWQPINGATTSANLEGLRLVRPWLEGIHVFHWWPTHLDRHLLAEGADRWRQYLAKLDHLETPLYAMLEFVKDDQVDAFHQDAKTLHRLLNA